MPLTPIALSIGARYMISPSDDIRYEIFLKENLGSTFKSFCLLIREEYHPICRFQQVLNQNHIDIGISTNEVTLILFRPILPVCSILERST